MTQTVRLTGVPGLLDPNLVLRRHVEDLSARFAGMVSAETVHPAVDAIAADIETRVRGLLAELGA